MTSTNIPHGWVIDWCTDHRDDLYATVGVDGDPHVHFDPDCGSALGDPTFTPYAAVVRTLLTGQVEPWPRICGCVLVGLTMVATEATSASSSAA